MVVARPKNLIFNSSTPPNFGLTCHTRNMDFTRQYVTALRQMMGRPSSREDAASLSRRPRSEQKDQERPPPRADKVQEIEEDSQQQLHEAEGEVPEVDGGSISSGGSTAPISRSILSNRRHGFCKVIIHLTILPVGSSQLALKFLKEFNKGVRMQALSSSGDLLMIRMKITSSTFSWGHPDSSQRYSVPLENIARVVAGFSPHMDPSYVEGGSDRAFHIELKSNSSTATFLTPSHRHRGAFLRGMNAVLAALEDKLLS